MNKKKTIYFAGPISGMTGKAVMDYYAGIEKEFGEIFNVLSPVTGKGYLRTNIEYREQPLKSNGFVEPLSTNHAIFERDKWMVSNSDIICVNLLRAKERASIGSMMELAWASLLNKHTIVIMGEENVHRHAFVLEAADIVFTDEEEAYSYLKDLA